MIIKSILKRYLSARVVDRLTDARRASDALRIQLRSMAHGHVSPELRRVRIEPSSRCNLRCQHCPTGTDYRGSEREIMSLPLFGEILRQMAPISTLRSAVLYLGGEPLLNPHLAEMCRRVKEETSVRHVQFVTNAMLLDEERCRQLSAACVDSIEVSIDGRSPEENDHIRRGASYALVRENVHRLRRYLPAATAITLANTIIPRPDEIASLPRTPDFLVRGFPGYSISTLWAQDWPALSIGKSDLAGLERQSFQKRVRCTFPFSEMSVRASGDVVLCCYDLASGKVMGNVRSADLLQIWTSDEYRRTRRALAPFGSVDELPGICRSCRFATGLGLTVTP